LAVFVLMTVAAVLPAASEVTMLYGGALASGALAGQIALFGHTFEPGLHAYIAVVITGVVGNTLGAVGGWLIGYYGGHPLLERYGRYIHVTPARIARAERWFARFQGVAVPLGFATPLVRSFVAIPAGILEVPLRRFVPLAIIGITIFCAALAGIGWAVGSNWDSARHALRYVDFLVAAGILALAVVWFVRRRRSKAVASRS
jgi:membrane protein DedA with SNARE-associated domain